MRHSLKSLGIDQLSVAERLQLVEEIWDTIDLEAEGLPLPEAQRDDLAKRLAAFRADPTAGSTWDLVKSRIGQKP